MKPLSNSELRECDEILSKYGKEGEAMTYALSVALTEARRSRCEASQLAAKLLVAGLLEERPESSA